MSWRVVHEFGVEYAEGEPGPPGPLSSPSCAERAADGTTLIVDELATEKCVPIRAESRTLRVDERGRILYDSRAEGIDDGYGRLLGDGGVGILRRTQWELLMVSPRGQVTESIDLSSISKRMPRIFSATGRDTFLIAFLDNVGELDLVEIDRRGRLLWWLAPPPAAISVPGSLELLDNGHLLLADEVRHVVLEIDRGGAVVRRFGEPGQPSAAADRLSSPKSATRLGDGEWLIGDTRNHRVLLVDRGGGVRRIAPAAGDLWAPASARRLANGRYLISDAGNGCVLELDGEGRVVWRFGTPLATRRWLSFPRSVEVSTGGSGPRFLVCDTAHNRVVEVANGGPAEWPFRAGEPLFWPRCARWSGERTIVIADGRNRRIVETGPDGTVLRELHRLRFDGVDSLGDPHDVRVLPGGHLLIVDPSRGLVLEADWSGQVHWTLGAGQDLRLADPHSAQLLPDGRFLVSDTGNDRLLLASRDGGEVTAIDSVRRGACLYRLHRPRYAELSADGRLVIVDTGNNRVLVTDGATELLWELAHVPGSRLPRLNQPRWAQLVGGRQVVVCDHYNHRILLLARDPE